MSGKAVLHLISDHQRHHLPLVTALVEGASGGADVLQVRNKKAPALETYELVSTLRESCRARGLSPRILVNDRIDVAMATGADGVHLASKSLAVSVVRLLKEQTRWPGILGSSVHSYQEAIEATESVVDYITFGHVYASESHRDLPPRGLRELARIVEAVNVPVIAIGGIDVTNVAAVLETGVSGVAVIGAVLNQDDPARAAYLIKEQMEKTTQRPRVPFPASAIVRPEEEGWH